VLYSLSTQLHLHFRTTINVDVIYITVYLFCCLRAKACMVIRAPTKLACGDITAWREAKHNTWPKWAMGATCAVTRAAQDSVYRVFYLLHPHTTRRPILPMDRNDNRRDSWPPTPGSLYHATTTVDDLTIALTNYSRVPSPEPRQPLTCCCGSEDCECTKGWLAFKSKLESRLILSAGTLPLLAS
jgi:hypothetical protein